MKIKWFAILKIDKLLYKTELEDNIGTYTEAKTKAGEILISLSQNTKKKIKLIGIYSTPINIQTLRESQNE